MIIQVTEQMFRDEFISIRPTNFSYEAITTLFEYYEELDDFDSTELDVIAICCGWTEYTEKELEDQYEMTILELEENTTVLDTGDDTYLVEEF